RLGCRRRLGLGIAAGLPVRVRLARARILAFGLPALVFGFPFGFRFRLRGGPGSAVLVIGRVPAAALLLGPRGTQHFRERALAALRAHGQDRVGDLLQVLLLEPAG